MNLLTVLPLDYKTNENNGLLEKVYFFGSAYLCIDVCEIGKRNIRERVEGQMLKFICTLSGKMGL